MSKKEKEYEFVGKMNPRKMDKQKLAKYVADLQQHCFEVFAPLSENMQKGSFDIGYGTISFDFTKKKSEIE